MSAQTEAPALPSYCYPKQYQQVISEVTDHQMEVLHSDGLYRHVRFAAPGTRIWSFDLITWPGYLTIVGDIGNGYTFTRSPDMFTFFDIGQADGHINASYWSEKIAARRDVMTYSEDRFTEHVNETVEEHAKDLDPKDAARLREEVKDDVLSWAFSEPDALNAWEQFAFQGQSLGDLDGAWWLDYDHHFLIAVHAILWGVKKYHAQYPPAGR